MRKCARKTDIRLADWAPQGSSQNGAPTLSILDTLEWMTNAPAVSLY